MKTSIYALKDIYNMHQRILQKLFSKKRKEKEQWVNLIINNNQQPWMCGLLIISNKELRTIGVVRHLMNQFRKSRSSTEELDQIKQDRTYYIDIRLSQQQHKEDLKTKQHNQFHGIQKRCDNNKECTCNSCRQRARQSGTIPVTAPPQSRMAQVKYTYLRLNV